MLIPLTEWSANHKLSASTVRQQAQRGAIPAVKMGRDWFIDSECPPIATDNRVKSGKYKNWRKPKG